jgi:hypothetical protein
VDGQEHGRYFDVKSLTFSPDSRRLAYAAQLSRWLLVFRTGYKWFVVADGEEHTAYHDVKELTFSPDSQQLAYAARVGGMWCVIVDGQEGKRYDALGDLVFGPDGQRVAYGVQSGDQYFVVVDGVAGKSYDSVVLGGAGGRIVFESPDSFHHMAIAGHGIYCVTAKASSTPEEVAEDRGSSR